MGIELMSGFGNIQSYYNKAYEIPSVTPQEIKKQDEQFEAQQFAAQAEQQSGAVTNQELQNDNRSRFADLENISLTFNKEDSFDYIGSESSLANLDVQKAISDMKKDSVLQEYQYFVGSSQNLFTNPADGMVFQK